MAQAAEDLQHKVVLADWQQEAQAEHKELVRDIQAL
jgi:hypothetical protein